MGYKRSYKDLTDLHNLFMFSKKSQLRNTDPSDRN